MATSYELDIIVALAKKGVGFGKAAELGIRPELFLTDPGRLIFQFMHDWYHDVNRYGTTPTPEDLKTHFPHIPLPEHPEHNLGTLADILRTGWTQRKLLTSLPLIQELAEIDAGAAMEKVRLLAKDGGDLRQDGVKMVDAAVASRMLMQQNQAMIKSGRGVIGYPWPWPSLNKPTQGIKRGDFIIVYGTPHVGKTMVLLNIIAHLFNRHNLRVALVCGHEMTADEVLEILSCMLAGVGVQKFRHDELTDEEQHRLEHCLHALEQEAMNPSHSRLVLFETQEKGTDVLDLVESTYAPDLIGFDAMYSGADKRWNFQTDLVEDVSTFCKRSKIPVIGTWQRSIRMAKEAESVAQDDYAFTAAIMQKPDLTIKLSRPPKGSIMTLRFPKARRLEIDDMRIAYVPGEDMSEQAGTVSDLGLEESDGPLWTGDVG